MIIFAGHASAGEKPWIEVKSPHFRVLTDSGAGDAKLVAREFEDFRALMAQRYPNFRLESGAPLAIFAAKDEETAKALLPNVWKIKGEKYSGYYSHSWEKQFAMVRRVLRFCADGALAQLPMGPDLVERGLRRVLLLRVVWGR